jgi:hypothetical protein
MEGCQGFFCTRTCFTKSHIGDAWKSIDLLMWRAPGYVDAGWRLGTDLLTLLGLLGKSRDPLIKGMTLLSKEWIGSFLVLVHHFCDLFVRWRHSRSWSEVKFCIFGLRC